VLAGATIDVGPLTVPFVTGWTGGKPRLLAGGGRPVDMGLPIHYQAALSALRDDRRWAGCQNGAVPVTSRVSPDGVVVTYRMGTGADVVTTLDRLVVERGCHSAGTTTRWPGARPRPVTCTRPSRSSNRPVTTATSWCVPLGVL
jgi:hypothetical protein